MVLKIALSNITHFEIVFWQKPEGVLFKEADAKEEASILLINFPFWVLSNARIKLYSYL